MDHAAPTVRRRTVRLASDRPTVRVPVGRAVRTHLLIAVAVVLAGAGAWTAAPAGGWGVAVALEVSALLLGGWAVVLVGSTLTWRGWNDEARMPWGGLAPPELVADPGRRLVLRGATHEEVVSVPVGFLAADAALVADLVGACRTDPRRRDALGTDVGLQGLGSPG